MATPKNSSDLLRHTRKAKLMLKGDAPVDREELLDMIERLERFGITADKDRDLERITFSKWQETAQLAAPKDKRHIGKGYGEVIDGKTLARLYKERDAADLKRAQAAEKRRAKQAAAPSAAYDPSYPPYTPQNALSEVFPSYSFSPISSALSCN
ncbi:hypothetical protein EV426DRAFT_579029 [Tirmania nivea]|nr:hypothetical protein EV426DRAFT_579029 [Tirmania nivea]